MIQSDLRITMTLALQIWAGLGPVVGGGITLYLTRSWQHKQWLLDNRKQEFKELISAISAAHVEWASYETFKEAWRDPAPLQEANKRAMQAIADRIYIARDVEKLGVKYRFGTSSDDNDAFHSSMRKLIDDLVEVARKG